MMIKIGRLHLIGLSFIICQLSLIPSMAQDYNVVPLPQSIEMQKGEPFALDESVQILASAELQKEAEF